MIIVKGFLYVIAPAPVRWETKVGPLLRYQCRKKPVSLGDLLDRLSGGSIKMKRLFEISKGSPLHTTHAGFASE